MKHFDPQYPKPEIVIALSGPAGTDLKAVSDEIADQLQPFGYHTFHVRVSELVQSICAVPVSKAINDATFENKVGFLMNAADRLRRDVGSGAATVPLIASRIRYLRQSFLLAEGCDTDTQEIELYNSCFIINSLKHPDEVRLLRHIYREKLVIVSASTDMKSRIKFLTKQISKSHTTTDDSQFAEAAARLIELDKKRPGADIGQNLSDTFHLADYFISVIDDFSIQVKRFVELLFSNPYLTPVRGEMNMFEASAAALRSADLSRQVGVVIASECGSPLSRGCNEVPRPGGGSYWPDMPEAMDNRDYRTGRDFNAVKKVDLIKEFIEFVSKTVDELKVDAAEIESLTYEIVFGKYKNEFKDLRVSNIIEFGRVVHAEMHAITDAARRGVSIEGSTLFSTTFPCHMCARHIISSGIKKVVYIEPYPKSMTSELYPDDVTIVNEDVGTSEKRNENAVLFEPFVGVAPRIFQTYFAGPKRKTAEGYTIDWNKVSAMPRPMTLSTGHLMPEAIIASQIARLSEISELKEIENVV